MSRVISFLGRGRSGLARLLATSAGVDTAQSQTNATTAEIMRMGNPALRTPAKPWTPAEVASPEARALVRRMMATMMNDEGIGLAAPQIGVSRQLIVVGVPADPSNPDLREVPLMALFNPKFVSQSSVDKVPVHEACLSVPGLVGKVMRYRSVRVDFLDETGRQRRLTATGFIAALFQHEIDHLNAVLYVDRVKPGGLYFRDEFQRYGQFEQDIKGTINFAQ